MSKNNLVEVKNRDTITDPLTEMLHTAGQLIQQAVETELQGLIDHYSGH